MRLSSSEWEYLINEWILKERDRNILKRKIIDGITYEQVAEEFDLSVQRIKAIVSDGRNKIYQSIK